MNKGAYLLTILIIVIQSAVAQTFTSVRDWPMPAGDQRGLVTPGFKIVPRFEILRLGNEVHVILKMDVTMSTAQNPVAPFSYRYLYHDKVYTDQDLGPQPFYSIKLARAVFSVRVQGADNFNQQIEYESTMDRRDLGIFSKDTKPGEFAAHIQALHEVSYYGTEGIERVITNLESAAKLKAQNEKAAATERTSVIAKPSVAENPSVAKLSTNTQGQLNNQKTTAAVANTQNSFWTDKPTGNKTEPGKLIPEQAIHQSLPDFVRTTNGGYFHKGADGKFREVTAQEYQQAKNAAAASSKVQQQPEQQKMTSEEVRAAVNKMFTDAQAQNDAINLKIEQKVDAWRQNYYYAEAIRNGKENLANLSTLNGNYDSVEQLEADFNQKYSSIRAEVNGLEEARNAKLSNAVQSNFNGSSTEQAIGQSMQLIGGLINSAKADKERKEAQRALLAERERQLAAIEAAKKKARLDLRNKLVQSFPDGGTPITSHKVTLPEVYMFAYITNKAAFNDDQAVVAVSSVFPVVQYSDGTFPYKTTVAGKLKGYAPGDVVLVGYYGEKQRAEQMRNSFINLAAKSELRVTPFALKNISGGNTTTTARGNDFWETGKKVESDTTKTAKKSDFWNN